MNVLFVSDTGSLLPLAKRVEKSGHLSTIHINAPSYSERGRGEVRNRSAFRGPLVRNGEVIQDSLHKLLEETKPELVVCDDGVGKIADCARARGLKTWGSNRWSDLCSSMFGQELLKVSGVDRPVQPDSASLSIGGIFNGDSFSCPFILVEERGMMNRGIGAQEVAGVCMQSEVKREKILGELEKLSKHLRKVSYIGPVSINRALHVGFSLPLFSCLYELVIGGTLDLLLGKIEHLEIECAAALRISLPPFPCQGRFIGVKMEVDDRAHKHLWLTDVVDGKVGGHDGDIGWVSARGKDGGSNGGDEKWEYTPLRECRRRCLRTVNAIINENEIPSLQYRTDIGVKSHSVMEAYSQLE